MLTAIVALVSAAVAVLAYRCGYTVGRIDGECGVNAPWPWSDPEQCGRR